MTLAPALVERVRHRLVLTAVEPTPAQVASVLREDGVVLGDDAVLELVQSLRDEIVGAGPLETWLRRCDVTDVLVNGPHDVWIDRGEGLERIDVHLIDEAAVRRLAQRLAASAGRRLDDASPHVDARLPDGTRLHAVLPPISRDGTVISLRVPRRRAFTLEDLIGLGSLDETMAIALRALVKARRSFLISGGTGSGKTTILSTLLSQCDQRERLVIVEDSSELMPDHPHVVRLESRPANSEGAGAVPLRDLVRQSLRMRPDRLIVGEVRGAEVLDLLMAFNTGHQGGCGTVHANSADSVPARLAALGMTAGITEGAMRSLVATGLDAVVHLGRVDGRRTVESVAVIVDGRVQVALDARAGRTFTGPGFPLLVELIDLPAMPALP